MIKWFCRLFSHDAQAHEIAWGHDFTLYVCQRCGYTQLWPHDVLAFDAGIAEKLMD